MRTIDAFAEALSQSGSIKAAAREAGVSVPYGRVLLQRIIKGLGKEQCR